MVELHSWQVVTGLAIVYGSKYPIGHSHFPKLSSYLNVNALQAVHLVIVLAQLKHVT